MKELGYWFWSYRALMLQGNVDDTPDTVFMVRSVLESRNLGWCTSREREDLVPRVLT
jgi:hypothetical protein